MFMPCDTMLYFYLLAGTMYVYIRELDNKIVEKPYKAYTTHNVMTNSDMYNIDQILETAFKEE